VEVHTDPAASTRPREPQPVERDRDDDLRPYAAHVVDRFGVERVMYGSDWPVVRLAGTYAHWFGFTQRFTSGWTTDERRAFYSGNATRFYKL